MRPAGLIGSVLAAVHHAEVVAHRVGEPFGTLILALAVTVIEVAEQLKGIGDRIEVLPDRILIYSENGEADLHTILTRGLEPVTSLVRRSSLEDVFLRLTGRTLVE